MHLYIKQRDTVRQVPEVTLENCIVPRVRQVVEPGIEPALWYKVLVCDAILVDIGEKFVRWRVDTPSGASSGCLGDGQITEGAFSLTGDGEILDHFINGESLFKEDECKDFDSNIDELFEIATDIFNGLSLQVFDREGNSQTYERVVQLLHVYILPNIRFTTKHHDNVQSVLVVTEKEYETLGSKVEGKCKEKHKAENLLRKMREKMVQLEDFQSETYIASLDRSFIETFLTHIQKDITALNQEFELVEKEIDKVRNSKQEGEVRLLNELRIKRTGMFDCLNKLVTAREQLKNVVSRHDTLTTCTSRHVETHKGDHDIQEVYMRKLANVEEMDGDTRKLMDTRLKVSAVREAVNLTLRELDGFGFSYGFNQKKGALETETDVVDFHKKPDTWLTLQEQVLSLLNTDTRFRDCFNEFCSKTEVRCQMVLSECRLFYDFDQSATEMKRHGSILCSDDGLLDDECEKICADVLSHISYTVWDMNSKLEALAQRSHESCRFHSNVYITYEELVLEKLLPLLNEIFEECNKGRCCRLSLWLSSVKLTQLGIDTDKLLGRKTDETRRNAGSPGTPDTTVPSTNAASFKDIVETPEMFESEFTINELYQRYNSASDETPDKLIGTFEEKEQLFDDTDCGKAVSNSSTFLNKFAHQFSLRKSSGDIKPPTNEEIKTTQEVDSSLVHDTDSMVSERSEEGKQRSTGVDEISAYFPGLEEFIVEADETRTLLDKMRLMTLVLKRVGRELGRQRESLGNSTNDVCADDLLDIVVVLLQKLDNTLLLNLYAQLKLITSLMPSFMQGGPSAFALITFAGAFEFLFQRMALRS